MNALFIIDSAHATAEQRGDASQTFMQVANYMPMFFQLVGNNRENGEEGSSGQADDYDEQAGSVEVLPHSASGSQDTNSVITTITSSQMPQMQNQLRAIETISSSESEESEGGQ